MHLLAAPDKFRGTLTAVGSTSVTVQVVRRVGAVVVVVRRH